MSWQPPQTAVTTCLPGPSGKSCPKAGRMLASNPTTAARKYRWFDDMFAPSPDGVKSPCSTSLACRRSKICAQGHASILARQQQRTRAHLRIGETGQTTGKQQAAGQGAIDLIPGLQPIATERSPRCVCRPIQGLAQPLRKLQSIVVRPEVHKEKSRLLG